MMTSEEFWSIVEVRGPEDCWLWPRGRHYCGYGEFKRGGRRYRTHRYAYTLTHGPIPPGAHVLHSCDTPACCNPAHLRIGTPRENAADREARGRGNQPNGERNANARLTDAQVVEIRERRQRGEYFKDIAADYGISKSHARYVALGIWRATPTRPSVHA